MIRWKFILVRLLAVALLLTLIRWGTGPLARWATATVISSATGARVDIAATDVGLFPPSVRYSGVQVADPRREKALRNFISADAVEFTVDGDALLHRRWVASNAKVSGLQIGSQRDESGHFNDPEEEEATASPSGPSLLGQLLGTATDRLESKASELLTDLETTRRSHLIRQRWEKEYGSLAERAKRLEKQIRSLRDQAKRIENPLRDYPALERTLAEANQVRSELKQIRELLHALPQQVQVDLRSMEEAKRIDLAKLDQYVPGELSESDRFGTELMAQAVKDQLAELRRYLEHGRTVANATIVAPESARVRGHTIDLLGDHRPADILVRRCEVNGHLRSGGKQYKVAGVLKNLSPTPQRLREPTHARLRLIAESEAAAPIDLDLVQDRRRGADRDRITLLWPHTEADPFQLSCGRQVGINVNGGRRELWAQIIRDGDEIEGRLVSKQVGLAMELRVPNQYADSPVATSLRESLAAVDRIEVDASFSGDWDDVDLRLETNLQRVLRDATADAVAEQLRASKQQLAAKMNDVHLKELNGLQTWLESHQQQTEVVLASADRSVEAMLEKVTRGIGSADAYLGKLRSSLQR